MFDIEYLSTVALRKAPYQYWYHLLDSNLFQTITLALVTLITGLIVLFLHRQEQKRLVCDAALIVYLQVKESERRIQEVQKQGFDMTLATRPIIKKDCWESHKHRLVRHLHPDHLIALDDFFSRAVAAEEARQDCRMIMLSGLEEKSRCYQRILSSLNEDRGLSLLKNEKAFQKKRATILQNLDNDSYTYAPQLIMNVSMRELNNFPLITSTSAGDVLRSMSEGKF